MSRFHGDDNPEAMFRAADEWRTQALRSDGSVLSTNPLWSLNNLEAIERHYVDAPDDGERTFIDKLKEQLAVSSPEVKQLAAEMIWLMLLCPSNIKALTKRTQVETVWSWSGDLLAVEPHWLSDQVFAGIGNDGQGFSYNRWRELVFLIKFMLKFKRLSSEHRDSLLNDSWRFAEWISDMEEAQARQLRHMILFMLFPEDFERISSAALD
jgi:5-methylcytosine-specific restriction protein B